MTKAEGYDYIIVGGGSGGCAVAARLSEDPSVSVCLVETGGTDSHFLVNVPAGAAVLLPSKLYNYAFETVPQKGLLGRRGYQPRGKVLGGSSAINAMCYIRGQAQDYDEWVAQGASGWSWDEVLPYFKKSENNERGADDFHGVGGPLNVADQTWTSPISKRFVEAGIEYGLHDNPDFNGARQDGIGLYQVTQKNGHRWSAAKAYLYPAMDRPNLTILTQTMALRLEIEGQRATGLVVADRKRQVRTIKASQGVVCAGGVFGTPQLLMLSGIGPADELSALGIKPILDAKGVGANLHDHPDYTLVYQARGKDFYALGPAALSRNLAAVMQYRRASNGVLSSNFAEGGAFMATDGSDRPDVQLHFVPALLEDHARKVNLGGGFTTHVCVLRPTSRGRFRLASADPAKAPLIDPNFLGTDEDVKVLLNGFKMVREMMNQPALKALGGVERHTKDLTSDADLIQVLRSRTDTVYHPVGTCRMGDDDEAVCDSLLKLRGFDNIWVADASVMPSVVSGNTNAPTIVIGERAADFIRQTTYPTA